MKRSTIQRKLTLEAVNSLHCHATGEEVYEEVSKEHPSVSRTTVYRNLKDLSDSGEIRKINNSGGADRFDHIVEKHYHVRCDKCGKLFDVDMPYMGEIQENVRNTHGFIINGYDLMFRGVCPDCQEKGAEKADEK